MRERLPARVLENPKKFGAIIERPDLFETKFLRLGTAANHTTESRHILCASRDPGSAAALIPVLKTLSTRGDDVICVTDGRAEEALTQAFMTTDLTSQQQPVLATELPDPDLILVDPSFSEFGIDTYTAGEYQDKPFVLVEDAYATANRFLATLIQKEVRLPDRICVLDEVAKQIIIEQFPQLGEIIVVTGQPAFDQFATEATTEIASAARAQLQLPSDQRVIVIMATANEGREYVEKVAEGLTETSGAAIIFRRHPRDNTPLQDYEQIFAAHGMALVDSSALSTTQVGALADCIVTTTSVEGLHAIYRRKPVVYCYDSAYVAPRPGLVPPPPVALGAALGVATMEQFSVTLAQALQIQPGTNTKLYNSMQGSYPLDGMNTQRVAGVIDDLLSR